MQILLRKFILQLNYLIFDHEAQDVCMINTIGKSAKGHPIKLYSYGQANAPQVLLYGLPDPGEAVGASGLLGLLRALKDPHHLIHQMNVRWNFIPCLNIDDQPNDGLTLELVQKEQRLGQPLDVSYCTKGLSFSKSLL